MNTEHKVEEQGKQLSIVVQRSSRHAMAALAGLGATMAGAAGSLSMFNHAVPKRLTRDYGPCIDCGKPARDHHCFKCQQKAA